MEGPRRSWRTKFGNIYIFLIKFKKISINFMSSFTIIVQSVISIPLERNGNGDDDGTVTVTGQKRYLHCKLSNYSYLDVLT